MIFLFCLRSTSFAPSRTWLRHGRWCSHAPQCTAVSWSSFDFFCSQSCLVYALLWHFPFVVEYLQASVHLSESQTTFLRTTFRKRVTLRWTCQTLEHMSGSGRMHTWLFEAFWRHVQDEMKPTQAEIKCVDVTPDASRPHSIIISMWA